MWYFGGEIVVECVAIVVARQSLCDDWKHANFLRFIFGFWVERGWVGQFSNRYQKMMSSLRDFSVEVVRVGEVLEKRICHAYLDGRCWFYCIVDDALFHRDADKGGRFG
jgi:hypothetical protein